MQVGRIAFLKPAVGEARIPSPLISGFNEVRRDVDAQHVRASLAAGNAVVPSPQPRSSTLSPSVIPRLLTNASPLSRMLAPMRVKSPFFPKRLVWIIHRSILFKKIACVKSGHRRSGSPGLLHSVSSSGGLYQAFAKVAAGKTDVFQFSIVELTENDNVCLTRPLRDDGSHPAL
jgi:hypothetical protein